MHRLNQRQNYSASEFLLCVAALGSGIAFVILLAFLVMP